MGGGAFWEGGGSVVGGGSFFNRRITPAPVMSDPMTPRSALIYICPKTLTPAIKRVDDIKEGRCCNAVRL